MDKNSCRCDSSIDVLRQNLKALTQALRAGDQEIAEIREELAVIREAVRKLIASSPYASGMSLESMKADLIENKKD